MEKYRFRDSVLRFLLREVLQPLPVGCIGRLVLVNDPYPSTELLSVVDTPKKKKDSKKNSFLLSP